ncbi:MAG TPA: DUF885 family protein [Pseudomonadota bacterium]|nr:DUF885 family protein [Pseudomonadota bacterium]
MRHAIAMLAFASILALSPGSAPQAAEPGEERMKGYAELESLFADWRAFEHPPLRDGAPDYGATVMARQHAALKDYQARLAAIDASAWPVADRVDYELLRAEMHGMDFNHRVLRPWARDPAFYTTVWTEQSDTPAHEGPVHHGLVELWTYEFPLSAAAADELAQGLGTIPPLLEMARANLTGNARELWLAGIGNLVQQAQALVELEARIAGAGPRVERARREALAATESFVAWLQAQAPSKTGPSGVGKENYTWYQRHVHLVPLSWEQQVDLLQRELARAHASLRLEEQRNRDLPPMPVITTAKEYQERGNAAVTRYHEFLAAKDIMAVEPWMDPAMRAHVGEFVAEDQRNFFAIATHYEPLTLYTHFYHWWDLARMREQPHASAIRRGPLLYNIWDSRAEGMATGMEEMMMHAGLYDAQPRAREIVWIMLAQRAARGLGSLYAHANEFTLKQAKDFHVAWTPRGWMREDLDLLGFEQLLYLRQPGYGTSYVVGKYQVERLLMERARQQGADFNMRGFFAEVDAAGLIPVSLIRWQLTGEDDELQALLAHLGADDA